MHVNAAHIFLRGNICVHWRIELFCSRNLAEVLKAMRKIIFIKAGIIERRMLNCCDFKSWSWILINRWSTEFLTSHHQRRVLAEFHCELGREIKQLRGSRCFLALINFFVGDEKLLLPCSSLLSQIQRCCHKLSSKQNNWYNSFLVFYCFII